MSTREQHWQQVYREKPSETVSWFEDRPTVSLRLIAATGTPKAAAVVDIGGGASRLVDCLLAEGFAGLTVLDLSQAALETARDRLPQDAPVAWIAEDVRHWAPERSYALWHDRAAFHFLTEAADQAAYLDTLDRALAPGGHAIIATFAPDGPTRCSGLPVQRYGRKSLAARLGPGYRLLRSETHDHTTPGGAVQRFHFGLFEKRE